jgi:cobalt-zinc-cadmium resistance protein CzcA
MLLTAVGMVQTRTSGNLMSLGAIDFGLIVDGAVIIVENCLRVLGERRRALGRALTTAERLAAVREPAPRCAAPPPSARRSSSWSTCRCCPHRRRGTHVPADGDDGHLRAGGRLRPLAHLRAGDGGDLGARGRRAERPNRLIVLATRAYVPVLRWALRLRWLVIGGALGSASGAPPLRSARPGVRADAERARPAGARGADSRHRRRSSRPHAARLERALPAFPEVALVFSRTGTAEMASDPMPPYLSDTYVILKPRREWPEPRDTKEDVRERIAEALVRIRAIATSSPSRSRCASTS